MEYKNVVFKKNLILKFIMLKIIAQKSIPSFILQALTEFQPYIVKTSE